MVCMTAWVVVPTMGTDRDWDSPTNDVWENPDNWFPQGECAGSDNCFHADTGLDSRIEVTDTNTACKTFIGDGTEDATRYLLIEAQQRLDVVGADATTGNSLSAASTTNNFTTRMASGNSTTRTTLTAKGHVKNIDLLAAAGEDGDYVDILVGDSQTDSNLSDSLVDFTAGDNGEFEVTGDVITSSVRIDDNWDYFNIDGDVDSVTGVKRWIAGDDCTMTIHGNVEGITNTLGTSAGTSQAKTTLKVGSIGDVGGLGSGEDWTLRGYTELTVSDDTGYGTGNFNATSETVPIITQRESSKITTEGFTDRARWDLFDNSLYTGLKLIDQGTWNLAGDSRVIAEDGVSGGSGTVWTVNSDGSGGGTFGLHAKTDASDNSILLNSSSAFNVGTSTLAGTVKADGHISGGVWNVKKSGSSVKSDMDIKGASTWTVDAAAVEARQVAWDDPGTGPVWSLTLKNGGSMTAVQEAWFENGSSLTYTGTGNKFELKSSNAPNNESELGLMGTILNTSGTSDMELFLSGGSNYEQLQMPPDVTALTPYDVEDITLKMNEHPCAIAAVGGTVEAVGPDYDGFWHPSNTVIFEDSPCVAAWGEIRVLNNVPNTAYCRSVADHEKNTPISGDPDDGVTIYRDALYVVDMTIAQNTSFVNQDGPGSGSGEGADAVNIYFGECTVECDDGISGCPSSVRCTSDDIPEACDCGALVMEGGKTAHEAIVTVYGDFDGDKGAVTDTDDLNFFNGAFPSCHSSVSSGTCPCGGGGEPACDTYNPLVDYNCNKIIDCTDWQKFVAYRGTSSGVNTDLSCTP
jgi:hypothetical protein